MTEETGGPSEKDQKSNQSESGEKNEQLINDFKAWLEEKGGELDHKDNYHMMEFVLQLRKKIVELENKIDGSGKEQVSFVAGVFMQEKGEDFESKLMELIDKGGDLEQEFEEEKRKREGQTQQNPSEEKTTEGPNKKLREQMYYAVKGVEPFTVSELGDDNYVDNLQKYLKKFEKVSQAWLEKFLSNEGHGIDSIAAIILVDDWKETDYKNIHQLRAAKRFAMDVMEKLKEMRGEEEKTPKKDEDNNNTKEDADVDKFNDYLKAKGKALNDFLNELKSGVDSNRVSEIEKRIVEIKKEVSEKRMELVLLKNRQEAGRRESGLMILDNLINDAVSLLENFKKKEFFSGQSFLDDFRKKIKKLAESEAYDITEERNRVSEAFSPLYENLQEAKKNSFSGENLKKLESELLIAHYGILRKIYSKKMITAEAGNTGIGSFISMRDGILEPNIFNEMKQIVERLQLVEDNRVYQKYESDFKEVKNDFDNRMMAHISWISVRPSIHGQGARKAPGEMSPEEFPLQGKHIYDLIHGGLKNRDMGDVTNADLGTVSAERRSWVNSNSSEIIDYNSTAIGYCMTRFDDIYEGRVPEAVVLSKGEALFGNEEPISTRNIHETQDELIRFVYEEEARKADEEGREPRFDKHLVLRAFKLHMMISLNQSFLAENSPTISDDLYYMFHWVEYCIKYALDGTNTFNPLQTLLLFDYGGDNTLDLMYGKGKSEEIKRMLKARGLIGSENLKEKFGFSSLNQLCDVPLIALQNVAQGTEKGKDEQGNEIMRQRVRTPTLTPPLRYFVMKDESGYPLRYPSQAGFLGRYITFDDVQTVDGKRIYEEMDFESMGPYLLEYYNQLAKNGGAFLQKVLKANEAEFLKTMDDDDFLNYLKNQGKYSMTLFPNVGILIKEGVVYKDNNGEYVKDTSLGKTVMNQIAIQLIFIKCLIETDTTRKNFWEMRQVHEYLQGMVRKDVVGSEIATAIEETIKTISKWKVVGKGFARRIADQIREQAKFK